MNMFDYFDFFFLILHVLQDDADALEKIFVGDKHCFCSIFVRIDSKFHLTNKCETSPVAFD